MGLLATTRPDMWAEIATRETWLAPDSRAIVEWDDDACRLVVECDGRGLAPVFVLRHETGGVTVNSDLAALLVQREARRRPTPSASRPASSGAARARPLPSSDAFVECHPACG